MFLGRCIITANSKQDNHSHAMVIQGFPGDLVVKDRNGNANLLNTFALAMRDGNVAAVSHHPFVYVFIISVG